LFAVPVAMNFRQLKYVSGALKTGEVTLSDKLGRRMVKMGVIPPMNGIRREFPVAVPSESNWTPSMWVTL
jgi:hypothetical protein